MAMAVSRHSRGGDLNGEETEEIDGGSEAPRLNCTLTAAIQGGKPLGTRGGGAGGRRPARPGEKGGGGRLGMTPDRWAPPVGDRVREKRGGVLGHVGRKDWAAAGMVGRGSRWAGGGLGRLDRFCFFSFSKPIFKPISNLLKFKSFTCFQIQILTQISPTILKAFHKPFLTTFQTYFKFKPLHKFSQFFFTIIFKNFHKYFKTFKTTPQPKQNAFKS
jgi:hypothetical protein